MATFEITVESPDAKPVRLLVCGENWVDAWHEGARALGDDPHATDAVCVVKASGAFHVQLPRARRTFIVGGPVDLAPGWPIPGRGHPLLVPESGGTPIRIHTPTSRGAARPLARDPNAIPRAPAPSTAPAPHAAAAPAPTIQPSAAFSPGAPSGPHDTIDRALHHLERERTLGRPVRIAAGTGLPEPIAEPAHGTPNGLPSRRTRRPTGGFDSTMIDAIAAPGAHAPGELLPQQFHPVMRQSPVPNSRVDACRWAVDTAFQHVPCALALAVEVGETTLRVVAAAGHLGRDAEGWLLLAGAVPTPRGGRLPTRIRFAADVTTPGAPTPTIRFATGHEVACELAISSSLVAPVDDPRLGTVMGLMLFNAQRTLGFTEGELSAMTYLSRTLAQQLGACEPRPAVSDS